ncbi:gas vesicle protein [Streptomyces nigrescens]|uniref:Gas vesicle protein n=2 Tax=Streptomyces TaxID=1883 RepID=A0ABM7ZR34_STRNI|nr:GvpL/GvpF family gas vesicle protein [Streptomyces nigrescens]MEE4419777.1 GvpL/GvpF family gas vesicle protein [Streptomyces sp. DSM 41528]BDM68794.1 gas vesicle protein [Streptomyces nigrescens]
MPVYVYSIVSRSHPQNLDGLHGVGDPPSELRTVVGEKLSAVVSDAPEGLRPKRRDLAAHQAVQERLMADGTALPLQFGFTADDEDAVRTVLEERAEEFAERLQTLEGCVEYHLKAAQSEEAMLREILTESDQARRMNEEVRSGRGGPDLPLALGELVAKEVETRKDRLNAAVAEALGGIAREETGYKAAGDDFLSVSFLVDRDQEARLRAAVQKIADELGEDFDLRLRGPLPVYSFV